MSFDLASFALGVGAAFALSFAAIVALELLTRPKRRHHLPVQQMPPAVLLTPPSRTARARKRRA